MFPTAPQSLHPALPSEFLPARLLDVVNELTEVVLEENAIMAEGMPAGVVATLDRKLALSDAYEELCAEVMAEQPGTLATAPELAHRLILAVARLREATGENLARLEAAMDASRRRVEAVMAAMRSEAGNGAPYGPGGDVPLGARLAAFTQDFHC